MFEFYKNWFEFFFLALVVIGILIALSSPSAVISYIVIFLSGIFAGRLIYERKNKIQFPYFMIIAGFVIGYLIGIYYGSRRVVIALFVIGAILSYKLYDKKILRDIKY
ncbi:hypothetical protein J4448_03375 [Candidatus Woesearchaeota archaeon]|nr:hypothetical protein [Candidatus Woesearchaeota archaeon]